MTTEEPLRARTVGLGRSLGQRLVRSICDVLTWLAIVIGGWIVATWAVWTLLTLVGLTPASAGYTP